MGMGETLRSQFGRPRGILGRIAGWVMATRGSNRERTLWVVGLLDIQPVDRILELGFGPGVGIEASAALATQGQVFGVDHSELMTAQASKRNRAGIGAGRIELKCRSVDDLPEYDARLDKIYAVNSMMFWDDPLAVLQELRRRMKPGAKIAIALQPRWPGATDEQAMEHSDKIAASLSEAGFENPKVHRKEFKPVCCVCVIGVNPR